jgi:CARDB
MLVAGVAALTAAPAVAATPPPTQLTRAVCHRALLPPARKIAVTAVMRPVNGTNGMEMMFDLQRARRRYGPFTTVRGTGLERWVHPDTPTLGQRPGDIWRFDQKVENLAGPAYYRFRVRFRWTGAGGHALRTSSVTGPTCFQPELRPDLVAQSLTVKAAGGGTQPSTGQPSSGQSAATQPAQDRYVGVIANRGLTSADSFTVELLLPGQPTQRTTVHGLRPHATARETFTAPACTPGSRLTLIVDPNGSVLDYDRANNTLTVQCPAATQARRYT